MTKELKFVPFEFTAIKTVTINKRDDVGIVTLKNTGDEDVAVYSAWTTSDSAFITTASLPTTLVFEQTFIYGTEYYKDTDGTLTTDATITGVHMGTGLNDNRIFINIYKSTCLSRMERQLDLWNNSRDYKWDIIKTRPCIVTKKVKRLRNKILTGN